VRTRWECDRAASEGTPQRPAPDLVFQHEQVPAVLDAFPNPFGEEVLPLSARTRVDGLRVPLSDYAPQTGHASAEQRHNGTIALGAVSGAAEPGDRLHADRYVSSTMKAIFKHMPCVDLLCQREDHR
jgi:hypothetical protein